MIEDYFKPYLRHNLKYHLKPYLKLRLSQQFLLEEKDVAELSKNIEVSEEFQKLLELKIVKRTPFFSSQMTLRPIYYYENIEQLDIYQNVYTDVDVKKQIASNPEIVSLIKKIGQENFKKYFLDNEGEFSFVEISKYVGISEKEVRSIFEFVNNIYIQNELEVPNISYNIVSFRKRYTTIAKINYSRGNFEIIYLTPSMFRGMYKIDYEKLTEFSKCLNKNEKTKIRNLLRDIELLNIRKISLHRIVELLIFVQREFMISGKDESLKICTQKNLAENLGICASTVSRLIRDKSIITPLDNEYPLEKFIINKKKLALVYLKDILYEKKYVKDKEIQVQLQNKLGININRRTVNYYKNIIQKGNKI
ncbi:MAG: hypothetical protein N2643_00330 [Endomicrobia bacterium]|nr:hypothetical protein [Endomicrobiia bacterium]